MPPSKYKVWQWIGAVGEGAMQSEYVGLSGVAKGNANGMRFTVANEYICGQLGRAACLPVPPAALVEKNGEPYHVSLDFNLSGQRLPPADCAALVQAHPDLACGVVLFDMWIVNPDRHNRNVAFDQTTNQVQLFDHSHAFLQLPDPIQRLQAHQNALGIGGHCIANALTSLQGMQAWFSRLIAIPEYYIDHTLETATGVGLDAQLVPAVKAFLLERRAHLLDLVNANQASFPRVAPDLWAGVPAPVGGNP